MKSRILAFLLLAVGVLRADPGWVNSEPASPETFAANAAVPVSPFTFGAPQMQTMGGPLAPLSIGNAADLITPEIQSLADGLQHDPIKIFNYVYNHIDFQAYYGSKKGAALTLIEGKGNQFDTCSLLVSLLRASGYDAEYRIGAAGFTYTTLRTWLGLSANPLSDKTDAQIIALFGGSLPSGFTVAQGRQFLNTFNFLTPRGYPIVSYVNGETYVFDHVWVQVTVGGNSYFLDPSLKGHFDFTPIDFLTASGYDRTTFLNAVGGTAGTGSIGTNSIKQISQSAIASQMATLSTNAANWIRANKPAEPIDVLTQGRRIQEREITSFAGAYPVNAYLTQWHPSIISATAIPDSYMSKLTLTLGVYNYTTKAFTSTYYTGTIKAPELMGKKLALTFSGNTGTVYFEDDVWRTQSVPNAAVDIKIDFTHDHYEWKWNGSAYVKQNIGKNNSTDVHPYRKGNDFAYVLPYGFDVNGKLLRKRQEKLDGYLRAGKTESSREVRTEVLNVMGQTWLYEAELSDLLVSANMNVSHASHHRIGRVGQEEAYYIDLFSQQYSNVSRSTTSEIFLVVPVGLMFQSALEHAVIEQTQGNTNQAASTIKALHLANQANVRLFRANSSNWQTGANIRGQLTGYTGTIGTALLASIDASVTAGGTVLVPEKGDLVLGSWKGSGFVNQNGSLTQMLISGGYSGGFNSQGGFVFSDPLVQLGLSEPGYYQNGSSVQNVPYTGPGWEKYFGADPVDMATGAFVIDKDDLQLGAAAPRGLSFARHYDGNRRYDDAPGLGYGWTHNCYGRATARTSVKGALGEVTSYQMVPWLMAAAVARDVYGSGTTAKSWAVPALIAQWATDQLRDNGVGITLGAATVEFVKMPDGTYVPPAGSKMGLTKDGSGNYFLSERHGSTMKFRAADGLLESITDQHGNSSSYSYTSGKISSITDCYSRTLTFGWSGDHIDSVSDGTGRSVGFGYSGAGDLTTFTDPEGKVWYYDYNTDHQIERLRDPLNRTITENTFDDEGRVVLQKSMGDNAKVWKLYYTGYINYEEDPTGAQRQFWYDGRGRPIGVGDALGNISGMAYDGQDHVTVEMTPAQELTIRTYNADNNLLTEQDPRGEFTTYIYDGQKRLERVIDKRGYNTVFTYTTKHQIQTVTDQLNHVTTYGYYGNGLLQTVTDPSSKTTTYAYDGWGQLNKTTFHDNTEQTATNNARGDVLSSTDAEARTVSSTYNKRRQLLTTTLPAVGGVSAVMTNTYDDCGNQLSASDGNGNTTTYTWNQLAQNVTTVQPALPAGNNVVTNVYDNREWIHTTTNSLGHAVTYEKDAAQRTTAVIDPLSRRTESIFDANDRLIEAKDALNRVTKQAWSERSELVQDTDGMNKNADYGFDENGNRTLVKNRRGKSFSFGYDQANRLTSITSPTGKVISNTYYANNQIQTIQEPSGQTTTVTYNGRNQVATKTDPTGLITYGYDDSGLLETVTEGSKVITRTYDERGRLKTFTDGAGNLFQYQYDGNGNLTRITYPGGKQVNYTYNSRNLLETVTDWASRTTTYQYDRLGRQTGIIRPNGTVVTYVRDNAGQLLNVRETKGGALFHYMAYGYDLAGQLDSRFRAPLVNAAWQQPTVNAVYDDDNRLTSVNGTSVVSDLDGNMTSAPLAATGGAVSLVYNSRNQLTSAGGVSYTYDAEGRRTSMTTSAGTTDYMVDPNGSLTRLLVKSGPEGTTYYVWGNGLLYEADGTTDATKTYHYDQVGSTVARTDDAGNVIGRAEYSPYGLVMSKSGDMATPFMFNGQYGVMADPNGLLHMRARFFSPYLMRFINADPIGFSGGLNLFAYCDSDPTLRTDALGLWFGLDDAIAAGAGALIGVAAQGVGDLISGKVSSWQDYTAAAVGGAAAGEATLYLGPVAGAAVGGLVTNATRQGLNIATGVQQNWDVASTVIETGGAALAGKLGSVAMDKVARGLSNATKGAIGEWTSYAYNRLGGATVVGEQVKKAMGTRTTADWIFEKGGVQYIVESKFGTSTLTSAQRAAQKTLGDLYQVERWGYDWVQRVGSQAGFGLGESAFHGAYK